MAETKNIIEAKNIFLSYKKDKYIIKKGNFTIKDKEFIFICGQSGSGKSTLLKSFYGEIPLKYGSLKIDNHELYGINSKKLRSLRKEIGVIFQDYKLINEYTIEKNIMIPLKINGYSHNISKQQAKSLLKHIKLTDKAKCYPNELSGGEQQRVAVARALAHNPKIIIADEPTGNLDDYSAEVVWNLLRGANKHLGITVVVVTHRVPKYLDIEFRQLSIEDGIVYEVS